MGGAAGAGARDGAAGESGDAARDGASPGDAPPAATGSAFVYVGGNNEIRVYTLDLATGALAQRSTVAAGGGYMAWDPTKKFMYAGSAGLTAFAIDAATGALTRINTMAVTMGGTMPSGVTHVSVHPSGKWVFTAFFGSGNAASTAVSANGGVGATVDIQRPGPEAHSIWSDATGQYAFVPCRSGNIVAQYLVDANTGVLTPNTPPTVRAEAAGAGPRHLAFHPTQKWAYVLNEQDGTTTSYAFDAATGRLSGPNTVRNTPMGVAEGASAHIVVHPTGKFVYASNRTNNSIVVFTVDQGTGRLTPVQYETGDGMIRTPRNFTLDPLGRYAVVASQMTGTVLVLRINPDDGKLTRVGAPVPGPSSAQFVGVITLP